MSKIHLPRNEQIKLLQSIAKYADCAEKFLDKVQFDCDLVETAEGYSSYLNSAMHDFPKVDSDTDTDTNDRYYTPGFGTYEEQVRREYNSGRL